MSYKPCSFDRADYLCNSISFDEQSVIDGDTELCEFNDDAECLAIELAYTRYYLAKAEADNERLSEWSASVGNEIERLKDVIERAKREVIATYGIDAKETRLHRILIGY